MEGVTSDKSALEAVVQYESYLDALYLRAIPRLIDETGLHLAVLSMLAATDALAGLYAPKLENRERFKRFVLEFFPDSFHIHADALWQTRNLMVHSFNPGQFGLVHGQRHKHLEPFGEVIILNGEDVFEALQQASKAYFKSLRSDPERLQAFLLRVRSKDGGAPDVITVIEYDVTALLPPRPGPEPDSVL